MLFAVDPTPPVDSTATASSALANFGDAAIGVFGDLVTNVWVLAIFAFGIAVTFAALVIARLRHRAGTPVDSDAWKRNPDKRGYLSVDGHRGRQLRKRQRYNAANTQRRRVDARARRFAQNAQVRRRDGRRV